MGNERRSDKETDYIHLGKEAWWAKFRKEDEEKRLNRIRLGAGGREGEVDRKGEIGRRGSAATTGMGHCRSSPASHRKRNCQI